MTPLEEAVRATTAAVADWGRRNAEAGVSLDEAGDLLAMTWLLGVLGDRTALRRTPPSVEVLREEIHRLRKGKA